MLMPHIERMQRDLGIAPAKRDVENVVDAAELEEQQRKRQRLASEAAARKRREDKMAKTARGTRNIKAMFASSDSRPPPPATQENDDNCATAKPQGIVRALCCNDVDCGALEQCRHARDWTVLGMAFNARASAEPLRHAAVPHPLFNRQAAALFWPDLCSTMTEARRVADTELSASDALAAPVLQLARMYCVESANLHHTHTQQLAKLQRRYDEKRRRAAAAATLDLRLLEELDETQRRERRDTDLAIHCSFETLEITTRERLYDIVMAVRASTGDCRVAATILVPFLLDLCRAYTPLSEEPLFWRAISLYQAGSRSDARDLLEQLSHEQQQQQHEEVRLVEHLAATTAVAAEHATNKAQLDHILKRQNRYARTTATGLRHVHGTRATGPRPSELLFPCETQWRVGDASQRLASCTAIAMRACLAFLGAPLNADLQHTTLEQYLRRGVNWHNVVESGTNWYRSWLRQQSTDDLRAAGNESCYQMASEVLAHDRDLAVRLRQSCRTSEQAGSLLEDNAEAHVLQETAGTEVHCGLRSLFDSMARCRSARENKPTAALISSRGKSFAVARMPTGVWWLFDSHGVDAPDCSTLGRFEGTAQLVRYTDRFFNIAHLAERIEQLRRNPRAGANEELELTNELAFAALVLQKRRSLFESFEQSRRNE